MSGIAGLLKSHGDVISNKVLERMIQLLLHRGPDGQKSWKEGRIGLAHCSDSILPENVPGFQPFYYEPASLCITADARVDNREELSRLLNLNHHPQQLR